MLVKSLILFFMVFQTIFCFSTRVNADENLDEVLVIGSRLQLNRDQLGSAVTVLDAEAVDRIGSPYLADLLRHIPGLAVSRTGPAGGLTQVRVRGSEANHVLVIIDGVEANSTNGEFDFSSLSSDNIERIEVLRGAQSGVYGSNATAGVINIVTGSANSSSGMDLIVESGSLDFDKQSVQLRGASESLQGSLSLNHQTIAFNAAPGGDEADRDENFNGFGKGQWQASENLLFFINGRYLLKDSDVDDQDFSGGPRQGQAIDTAGFSKTIEKSYRLGATLSLLDNRWFNTVSFDSSRFNNEGSFLSDHLADFGNNGNREKLSLQSRLDLAETAGTLQRGTVFIEDEKETYRNNFPFDPSQVPEQDRRLQSIGLEYFIQFNQRYNVSVAWRHDDNDKFEDANTYRVTSRILLTESSNLHASIGTGITNPSFFEQFGFIPGSYIGNPNLEPEQQEDWDIGWEKTWAAGKLITDVTYFNGVLEKEISGFFTPINENIDSERQGLELSFSWQGFDVMSISGNYTYTDASEDGLQEARRPKNMASVDATYQLANSKLSLNLGLVYNGKMIDTDFSTFSRGEIDAYVLINASARYDINDTIYAYLRVNNLLDEEYQEVFGFATPGIYGSAGLAVAF